MNTIFKCHGGKFYMKKEIISQFPKDYQTMDYCEPCFGSGSVFLNKLPSKQEFISDLDPHIYNLIFFIIHEPKKFQEKLENIHCSEETFQNAFNGVKDGLDGAVNEIILRRMSRGGLKTHFSWTERKRGGRPGEINSWENFKKIHFPQICERIKNAKLSNENILELIPRIDNPSMVYYCDPPYLPSTRSVPKIYSFEMTEKDHILLADILNQVKGKVLLSGYYSHLYAKLYKKWRLFTKEMPNHSGQTKQKERRIECLWINF